MVMVDDDGGRGKCCLSRRRCRLKVVLPSFALPPSCNDGGLRGAQNPVARCANAVANAVAPARCAAVGAAASRRRKTKAEAATMTATTRTTRMAQMARTTLASAISHRQGGFNNQQGREGATEGSGVSADGRTMMQQWLQQTTTAGTAAIAQAAAVGGSRSSSPFPPSQLLAATVVGVARRSPSCVAQMPGKDNNLVNLSKHEIYFSILPPRPT